MMGMVILCALLWLMLGEAVRLLAMEGAAKYPRYRAIIASTPK
jgi:hypothetical protein